MEVNLRAPEPEDLDVIYLWENDPEVWHLSNTLSPFSRYVLKQYLDSAHKDIFEVKQLRLIIELELHSTKIPVGAIDLFDFEPLHQRAGIGILIARKEDRLKGIGTIALEKLLNYSFNILQLHQLYCNITPDNITSLNLFKKFGFKETGVKRSWLKTPKGWSDEIFLQLINPLHD